MLSYYHYWQAVRRLELSTKTLELMQPDVPDMVQAQHEMIERELEYYREESQKFTIILLILFLFCGIMLILFTQGLFYV
jgi:hypothetical protein